MGGKRGATSWPRTEPRPQQMSWKDYFLDFGLMFGRPVLQVALLVQVAYPFYKSIASFFLIDLGWSEALFFAALTVATHHFVWAIMNSFFLFLEHINSLGLERFRLPTAPASIPSASLQWDAVIGTFLGGGPMFIGAYVGYPIYKHFGAMRALDPLPAFSDLCVWYILVKMGSIITFDLTHRLIHSRKLYRHIHHKQ